MEDGKWGGIGGKKDLAMLWSFLKLWFIGLLIGLCQFSHVSLCLCDPNGVKTGILDLVDKRFASYVKLLRTSRVKS